MALDRLPPEIFLLLADFLTTGSLNALIRTQKRAAFLMTPYLYRGIIKEARSIDFRYDFEKVPYWLEYMSCWRSQIILDYFRGVPQHLLKPEKFGQSTLLQCASLWGNIELAQIMMSKGLRLNCRLTNPLPLHLALKNKQESMAVWLLEAGAYAYLANDSQEGVLNLAMECSHDMLQLILENLENNQSVLCSPTGYGDYEFSYFSDSDEDAWNEASRTHDKWAQGLQHMKNQALLTAAEEDYDKSAFLLLQHGADPSWEWNAHGTSILEIALFNLNYDTVSVLLDRSLNPHFDDIVKSTLRKAIEKEWPWHILWGFLHFILISGCHIDSIPTPKNYPTVLHYFVSHLHVSAVDYLLENGASIHGVTSDGRSVLHTLLSKSRYGPVEREKIFQSIMEVIQCDKSKKFDHTVPSGEPWKGGNTLHLAVRKGFWKEVCLLINSGIDTEVTNDEGKTALDIAKELGHQSLVKVLSDTALAGEVDPTPRDFPN